MKTITVTVAEGKRDFSRLVKEAAGGREEIVVTRRGKPMVVMISFGQFMHDKKVEARSRLMHARAAFAKAGVTAAKIYRVSKEELEARE